MDIEDKLKINEMLSWGFSQRKVSRILDIPKSTINDFILGKTHKSERYAWQVDPGEIKEEDKIVGIIPDTHSPFQHKDTIPFLADTFKSRGVNTIVHIGDEIDLHASSRFITDQKAMNYEDELYQAREFLRDLSDVFPYATVTSGNHTKINYRKAKEAGIDIQALKPLGQYLHLPDTWKWVDNVYINGVRYQHKGKTGMLGAINTAKDVGCSCVIGHSHVYGNITYRNNSSGTYFGMDVGCMINKDSYAFNYASEYYNGLTLGCGVVYSSSHAEFVPYI